MDTNDLDLDALPEILGHDDVDTAQEALESARSRLRDLENEKAELQAQIPELKSTVDDLRVAVAQPDQDAGEEDLEAAREEVRSAKDQLDDLETERIPSQELAVERLDQNIEDTKDDLGNRFAPTYQAVAIELLEGKAQACRKLAEVLDLCDTFDGKRSRNRVQNEYGPEVPSVPALSEEVSYRRDSLDAEELRDRADELDEQAARLREEE